MSLLRIRNLSVDFATASGAFRAVDAVDQDVDTGEILAIVGESGSGKSVSMLAVMGLLPWTATVTADEMSFDGKDLLKMDTRAKRRIIGNDLAMIFQEPMSSLNPCFSVGWQIKESLRYHLGLDRRARHARAIELFEQVGIPDPVARMRQFPHELSGGQRQRVLIALALACNPGLLIADEPTTALDANVALKITDLLVRLSQERGMALVFITHDLAAVARATQDIVVMYGGDMVEQGTTAEVLAAPTHPYTKGLLDARPDPTRSPRDADGKRHRLPTIPGTVPQLFALPQGCRFSGRCPVEVSRCATFKPALKQVGPRRRAACHLHTGENA